MLQLGGLKIISIFKVGAYNLEENSQSPNILMLT